MFQEVLDGIWFVKGKNNGKYVFSNSLFIDDEKKVLIDTGLGRSVIKKLIKKFGQPDVILYTHGHEDHVSEKDRFTTNERYIHEGDHEIATSKVALIKTYDIEQSEEMDEILDMFFAAMNYSPLTEVKTFKDQYVFDFGSYKVKALLTPGHTEGHCCFEILNNDLIFSGDIDLSRFGPFYGATNADIMKFDASIQYLIDRKPQFLVSSHKGVYEGEDVITNLKMFKSRIWEREELYLDFIGSGKTFGQILDATLIYHKLPEPKEFWLPAERLMDKAHLQVLIQKEKIAKQNGKYVLI